MKNSIDQIIETAFTRLKAMADADTIVGRAVTTDDGTVLIPISKLSVGFVAGGGEYSEVTLAGKKPADKDFPFAGGSGAGLSVSPIAFIVVKDGKTDIFSVDQKTPAQKLFDMIPDVVSAALEKIGVNPNKSTTVTKTTVLENEEQ